VEVRESWVVVDLVEAVDAGDAPAEGAVATTPRTAVTPTATAVHRRPFELCSCMRALLWAGRPEPRAPEFDLAGAESGFWVAIHQIGG